MKLNVPINRESFPHRTEKGVVIATIENLEHLLKSYGIQVSYDEVLKEQYLSISENINDLSENAKYARIKSLLALNHLPASTIELLPAILEKHTTNKLLSWIKDNASKRLIENNQTDYIHKLLHTLHVTDYLCEGGTPILEKGCYSNYVEKAITTWLIQCVAALDSAVSSPRKDKISKFELVLVLQGKQGLGKTTWLNSLLPNELSHYFKAGAHLDIADKDSVKKCISSWICELGELDSTFRKSDIARLKAFLSNEYDEIRLPYDRVTSKFRRKTSFCATVNPTEFLTDTTGSRRFLPLEVVKCDRHDIDVGQLWGQVFVMYQQGAAWWCDKELEQMLIERHEIHTETVPYIDLINDYFDINASVESRSSGEHLTVTTALMNAGIKQPTKEQVKQAKQYLINQGLRQVFSRGKNGFWLKRRV